MARTYSVGGATVCATCAPGISLPSRPDVCMEIDPVPLPSIPPAPSGPFLFRMASRPDERTAATGTYQDVIGSDHCTSCPAGPHLYSLFSILYSLFSILYSLFSILYSLF